MKFNDIIKETINKEVKRFILNEAEWAFHHIHNTNRDGTPILHNGEPYYSENKYVCYHETGQFGSGTYFSSYNTDYEKNNDMDKYVTKNPNKDPNFILIDDYVYRVDLDLYKNLYRVYTVKQGDILHTMMSKLNEFYHKVSGMYLGQYMPQNADYSNALIYQQIATNANSLGLECPSYLKLTRMAQNHAKSDAIQSFSTVFMEYNGFNGVNVSGVDIFDTSRHGSVIYDLSKVSDKIVKTGKMGWFRNIGFNHTNTFAVKNFDDDILLRSFNGRYFGIGFEKLTSKQKMRYMKNIIDSDSIYYIEPKWLDYYFKDEPRIMKYIFWCMFNHKIDESYVLKTETIDLIVKYNQEQFINYKSDYFFEEFLSAKKWDFDTREEREMYLNHLLSKLKRPLTKDENDYIENWYYDDI